MMLVAVENLLRVGSACGILMAVACLIYSVLAYRSGHVKKVVLFTGLGMLYILWSASMVVATRHSHVWASMIMMGLAMFSLLSSALVCLIKQNE